MKTFARCCDRVLPLAKSRSHARGSGRRGSCRETFQRLTALCCFLIIFPEIPIPNFCPVCGRPVLRADASFCEDCGADLEEISQGNDDTPDDDEAREDEEDWNPEEHVADAPPPDETRAAEPAVGDEPGSFSKAYVSAVAIVGMVVGCLGALALWIWGLVLIHENWGEFWTFFALFTGFLPFAVIVTCFWWGVPQFFLAALACVSGFCATANADGKKGAATLSLLGMLVFGGSACYVGWGRAHTLTARDMDQLTDDSLGVILVLRTSDTTKDPEVALRTTRARAQLRDTVGKYDAPRKNVIAKIVGDYLVYEKELQADLVKAIEARAKGEQAPLTVSSKTREALGALPERIRKQLAEDTEFMGALDEVFGNVNLAELPENWRDNLSVAFKMKSSRYAAAYEDMLGRPIPIPK